MNGKENAVSHKLDDLPQGKQECFWCSRVFEESQMRRERRHDTIIFVCKDCS